MSEEFILDVTNNYSNFEEWLFYYRVGRNLSDEEIKHMRQVFNSQQAKIDEQENRIKAILATQKTLLTTRFNEGLQLGLSESKRAIQEAHKAKQNYLDENEKLTNLLLQTESKLEEQNKEIEALRGFAKETCDNNAVTAFKYGLFDTNYDKTYILTGEK